MKPLRLLALWMVMGIATRVAGAEPGATAVPEAFRKQVDQLGAADFSTRRRATDALIAAIVAAEDAVLLAESTKNALTPEPGQPAAPPLPPARAMRQHLQRVYRHTTDPEVRTRLRKVLSRSGLSLGYYDLEPEARAVARLPFETYVQGDGMTASRRTYTSGGFGVTDIGNIRIVKKGLDTGTSSSSHIHIRGSSGGGGSSGSGKRIFSYRTANNVTDIKWGDLEFQTTEGNLVIGRTRVPFTSRKTVVFVSPEGTVSTVVKARASP